jgi:minor curlin subunit
MAWRWIFPIILAAVAPARADDLVSMTQVTGALASGALAVSPLADVSRIAQSGYGNVGQTNQTGVRDGAVVKQIGNNNFSSIQQTSVGEIAVSTQIGNGLSMTIHQAGPGQAISITQHR